MSIQNFNILDCTLRDGGYYNKWNFSHSFVKNYLDIQNKKTFNEKIEDIEILRFLELGYRVDMIEVKDSIVAIDTASDLERARLHARI